MMKPLPPSAVLAGIVCDNSDGDVLHDLAPRKIDPPTEVNIRRAAKIAKMFTHDGELAQVKRK